jgi:hypothetical protein
VMLINGVITEEQHAAGFRYAWLHSRATGRGSVTALNYTGEPKGTDENSEQRQHSLEVKFGDAVAVLKRISSKAKSIVDSAVVYERYPARMLPKIPTVADITQGHLLVTALNELAEEFGLLVGRAA